MRRYKSNRSISKLSTTTTQSLTLTSTGTSPVTVTAASVTGAGFTLIGGSFPVTLNPTQTLTLQLQFAPNPGEVLRWMAGEGAEATVSAYGGEMRDGFAAARDGPRMMTRWTSGLRDAMNAVPGHTALLTSLRHAALTQEGQVLCDCIINMENITRGVLGCGVLGVKV